MPFEWGDKVFYKEGRKTVEALFVNYVGESNSRILMKGTGPTGTSQVPTAQLSRKPAESPLFSFQRGAPVLYDGEAWTFEVEYKTSYVIGKQDKSLRHHADYYDKIHDMYFIKAPKDKVSPFVLMNQNLKHLLEEKT